MGPSSVNVTVVPAAGAPAQGPPPVGFVTGPSSGYPSQTGYPPQPGYMQQPPAGYAPYPTQSGPSPYPMQPTPQQVPHQQGYYSGKKYIIIVFILLT